MQTVKTILLLLVCSACLAACGLKGPLYFPDETTASKPGATQESDAEDTETEEAIEKKDGLPR